MHSSVRTSNLETSLRLLAQGANPSYFYKVILKKKQLLYNLIVETFDEIYNIIGKRYNTFACSC